MNRDGKPIEIKDFGRVNTAYAKLEEQDRLKEEAKKAKRAQYLVEIEHAKLLLPPKAEPGQLMHLKGDKKLYAVLEENQKRHEESQI